MSTAYQWTAEVRNAADDGASAIRAQEELTNVPFQFKVEDSKLIIELRRKKKTRADDDPELLILARATKPFLEKALEELLPELFTHAFDLAREAERKALDEAQQAVMPPEIRKMTEASS